MFLWLPQHPPRPPPSFARTLSIVRVHYCRVLLLGSPAVVKLVKLQLQPIREYESQKFAQLTLSCWQSKIPLERVIVESQHSSCSPHTTALSLVKENLVSAFDGISDWSIFNNMAVEGFSSVLKKGLTCTTFWNCPRPGIVLAAYSCSDFIRKRMCTGILVVYFFVNISDISDNKENCLWVVFLLADFE